MCCELVVIQHELVFSALGGKVYCLSRGVGYGEGVWIDSFLRGQGVREQGWSYGFGYIVVDQCILIEDIGLTLFIYTFCIYCMSGF